MFCKTRVEAGLIKIKHAVVVKAVPRGRGLTVQPQHVEPEPTTRQREPAEFVVKSNERRGMQCAGTAAFLPTQAMKSDQKLQTLAALFFGMNLLDTHTPALTQISEAAAKVIAMLGSHA